MKIKIIRLLGRSYNFIAIILKLKLSDADKLATVLDFDRVLGLGLDKVEKEEVKVPKEVIDLVKEREEARKNKEWGKSDEIRDKISELGFIVEDTQSGSIIKNK